MNIKSFADGTELSTEERDLLAYLLEEEGIELSQTQPLPPIVSDPEKRHQPFGLTNIQQAYWIGRSEALELGNVAAHAYWEIESINLDLERYEKAWQRLIERHEMLRAIVLPSGEQQILDSVPPYQIQVLDLRGESPEVAVSQLEATRQEMSHQILPTDRWPLFEIRASVLNERCIRQHISFDLLIGDDWSLQLLLQELWELYQDADAPLRAIAVSFRDYVLACVALQDSSEYQRSRDYWLRRVHTLPPAPELPLAKHPSLLYSPRFVRRSATLQPEIWQQLKTRANQTDLTPSGVLLAAFAEVLTVWSKSPRFTINLTLFNRLPLHPQINEIVGDFTSLSLLAIDNSTLDSFETHARNIQEQLWEDLDRRYFDGVQVLRELARIQGQESKVMPVVFTSTLTLTEAGQNTDPFAPFGSVVYSITQTPQVWLDHQVYEEEETLVFNWDAVEELFPGGLLDDMFEAYCGFLFRLANYESAWFETRRQLLPDTQLQLFAVHNATTAPLPDLLLHTLFEAQVKQHPHHIAIIAPNRTLTYQELHSFSQALGHRLRYLGAKPNTLVAVVMEKGWEQVVAVLGILAAGAAYIPIDPGLPIQRRWHLLEQAEVQLVLTQSKLNQTLEWPTSVYCICVDTEELVLQKNDLALHPVQQPEDLAYVIYTSGSTGMPKGVMIDHRGAVNTILDINKRFDVNSSDRVFALSSLSFDLSVYDIFGTLAAGATIVIPQANAAKDPSHWLNAIAHQQITVWNSVPALMQMLVEYAYVRSEFSLTSLRLVLLSGDWLPLTLPSRIKAITKNVQVISLGGATEASIWSILYPIETINPGWKSIPYGCPMTNQQFYVLNEALEPSPVWVPGQLYIGGIGLAKGYWQDEQKTAASFITHPVTGSRLYRTGDLGCYLPNGQIEFLGREDYQVKVGGYRIELGEIEAALVLHPAVHQAVVTADQQQSNKRLVAYVVPVQNPVPTVDELRHFLSEKLPEYMVPFAFMVLDALPLTPNGKVDRRALPAPEQVNSEFEMGISTLKEGCSRTEYVAPRTPIEKRLTEIWAEVLAVKPVGIHDNFFALGGNSILIMQAIARAKQAGIQLTPRQMFGYPTIVEVAAVASTATAVCTEQEPVTGLVPLTPIQHFLFEQDLPNSYPWNLTWLLEVRQKVDVSVLEAAFQHLLLYHDALRLRFERNVSGWEQYNASPGAAIAFSRVNLSHVPTSDRQQAIDATAAELLDSLNLSQEPLIGVALFELGSQKSDLLLIVVHHLVIDAVSMRFLVEDLQTVYQQLDCGQAIQLPPKSTSYQQWSKQLTEYAQSDKIQQELSYWLKTLPEQTNPLPVDYPKGINTECSTRTVSRFLNQKETHVLLREFPIYGTQAQEVLLTSLLCAMSQWTGESSLLLNFLGHGREEILEDVDVSRTVGWFTSIYPVFLDMGNGDTLEDVLRSLKQQIQRIPHRGIGYGILRYLTPNTQVAEKFRSLPQAEVAFNYFGQVDFSQASLFQFAPESPGTIRQKQGNRPHLLDVIGVISKDRLEMDFIYSENVHRQSTIESLADYFMETVRSIISLIVRL